MSVAVDRLLAEARVLSEKERAALVQAILESMDGDEMGEVWEEEIQARMQAVREDRVEYSDGATVLAELDQRFPG